MQHSVCKCIKPYRRDNLRENQSKRHDVFFKKKLFCCHYFLNTSELAWPLSKQVFLPGTYLWLQEVQQNDVRPLHFAWSSAVGYVASGLWKWWQ